jgi:hypothetical protein
MSEWLYVLVAVVAVGAALMVVRERGRRASESARPVTASATNRDYAQEREVGRRAGMSAEDQAWEASSKQRNLDLQQRKEDVTSRNLTADQGTEAP